MERVQRRTRFKREVKMLVILSGIFVLILYFNKTTLNTDLIENLISSMGLAALIISIFLVFCTLRTRDHNFRIFSAVSFTKDIAPKNHAFFILRQNRRQEPKTFFQFRIIVYMRYSLGNIALQSSLVTKYFNLGRPL